MAETQTELKSEIIGLSATAFDAFCEDISAMFGAETECTQEGVCSESAAGLKKRFRNLVAVAAVKVEGALKGSFYVLFDREGLFTLAGVAAMLPEQKILQNCKSGSDSEAEACKDAITEVGNLLVGSWDGVFREEFGSEASFALSAVFIGKPWQEPEQKIGLSSKAEVVFAGFKMTVEPFTPFKCGVIFPKNMLEEKTVAPAEQATADKKTPPEKPSAAPQAVGAEQTKASSEPAKEPELQSGTAPKDPRDKSGAPPPAVSEAVPAESKDGRQATPVSGQATPTGGQVAPVSGQVSQKQPVENTQPEAGEAQTTGASPQTAEQKKVEKPQSSEPQSIRAEEQPQAQQAGVGQSEAGTQAAAGEKVSAEGQQAGQDLPEQSGPVSKAIQEIIQSEAALPGEQVQDAGPASPVWLAVSDLAAIKAKHVMRAEVVWAGPDDTVEQALAKMQQHGTRYMLVGKGGALEGIISNSDMRDALSPYLKSMFSKWRRPLDDATLQIKVRWVMSRPVRTVRPEASLPAILENMSQHEGGCLPVVDEKGKVHGTVSAVDVLRWLLKSAANTSGIS